MVPFRYCRYSEIFRRVLAAGCIALVLALGVFAASPGLHEQLHHHDQSSGDDGCAVVLFSNGVSVPLAMPTVPPAPVEWSSQPLAHTTELWSDSPRYLLKPGRGPPVS